MATKESRSVAFAQNANTAGTQMSDYSCIASAASLLIKSRAGVVEWQTRRTQNPVGVTPWGFKSPLRHQVSRRNSPRQN
jgi:hypothetical protein